MKLKIFLVGILLTLMLAPVTIRANLSEALDNREADESVLSATNEHEPVIFVTTGRLRLRPAPSTDNTPILTTAVGTRVTVLDFGCGEWFSVDLNGTLGYMNSEYLSELPPQPQLPQSTGVPGAVELIEWHEARNILTIGTPATIVDVRTGLTWQMSSFSNGSHADVRPLSQQDTDTILQAFGGAWTWTPRPIWVTVNGRTIAASINGMPHGGTGVTNGMRGHVCIHFKGSLTHNRSIGHERDHQNAVMEAFNAAQ